MSEQLVKLLFDECLGKVAMERLRDLVAALSTEAVEFKHILDFQREGVQDRDWIPLRAKEGWVLLSTDRGKSSSGVGKSNNLPRLCHLHGMTHILISSAIHRLKQLEKTAAIMQVWDGIIAVAAEPPGTGFLIHLARNGRVTLRKRTTTEPS